MPSNVKSLLEATMSASNKKELDETGNTDYAYEDESGCRFRFNVFRQRGAVVCGYSPG